MNNRENKNIISQLGRFLLVSKLSLVAVLVSFVIPMAAFEAHVVNVTATIERKPAQCDALSIGYWRNHEGCSGGEGESDWTSQIHIITTEFSGVFYNITGEEICAALWVPNCPGGNSIPSKRCKATAVALANELNLVSERLSLDALLAGADDGSAAFDHLGLNYNSTVRQALEKIEYIIANNPSTAAQLTDVAYVAERIYAFYEDENPDKPYCVLEPITLGQLQSLQTSTFSAPTEESGDEETNEQTFSAPIATSTQDSAGISEETATTTPPATEESATSTEELP